VFHEFIWPKRLCELFVFLFRLQSLLLVTYCIYTKDDPEARSNHDSASSNEARNMQLIDRYKCSIKTRMLRSENVLFWIICAALYNQGISFEKKDELDLRKRFGVAWKPYMLWLALLFAVNVLIENTNNPSTRYCFIFLKFPALFNTGPRNIGCIIMQFWLVVFCVMLWISCMIHFLAMYPRLHFKNKLAVAYLDQFMTIACTISVLFG